MKRSDFKPSPLAQVQVRREGKRYTLVFVRELRHAPELVWRALTDPVELRQWAPFDADHDLATLGSATLSMVAPDGSTLALPGVVQVAEPPRLLEYTWDHDLLRWELEATASGTRLTLLHTMDDREWLPKTTAGWHICLDVAELYLAGTPIGRIVGEDAKKLGWEELNAAYSAAQGST
jgi:uncharacterized protein YndB with AHSA1/START domain